MMSNRVLTGLKLAAVTIVIIAVLYYFSSLAPSKGGSGSITGPSVIEVTDLMGRHVRIHEPVKRIVALGPGSLRILVYLNATSLVVGVEAIEKQWDPIGRPYIMAHPEPRQLPVVGPGGPGKMPDIEKVKALHPDVVFVTFLTPEQVETLQEKLGVPVVYLGTPVLASKGDLDKFFQALRLVASIVGREERAEQIINYTMNIIEDLEERTSGSNFSLNIYVGGIGFKGKRGITSTWCQYPLFQILGVESVVDKTGCTGGHMSVSKEFLLERNPDIIFIDENGLPLVLADYSKDKEFYLKLKAVREGRVYGILPYNYYGTNYELALADAYYIGKILFPKRFADIDPVEKADEIIAFFDGRPLYSELASFFGGFTQIDLAGLAGGQS